MRPSNGGGAGCRVRMRGQMIVEIKVPGVGESITEVEIGDWMKSVGDAVRVDEILVAVESEKAALEIPSPAGGALVEILMHRGETAKVGEVIGKIDTEQTGVVPSKKEPAAVPAPSTEPPKAAKEAAEPKVMPSARRVLAVEGVPAEDVTPTGPGDRILKEDAMRAAAEKAPPPPTAPSRPASPPGARLEERVRMSLLRRTIANRLLEAKQSTAMLTTFNEIDMSQVAAIRKNLGETFLKTHQIKLGFMSFFIKAVVAALKDFPGLNARLEGDELVYAKYYDIGVAVGGGKGLVVPVIRNAETLGFAGIERAIADLGRRAKENSLTVDELSGGTFSITNGGVYGSMMSTPILNPPQSGILGLHAIKDRPVAVNGEVVIRPIMYAALSYDHRVVDGREAVTFLVNIKERIENPTKLLLEI